ncbi:hypothetical protein BV22DRAFT_1126199 [Leucogyrophana mollusca]|uniref:Uncharacterized protein n=1 Tax=Leucogyrophana mollusca TaxID=85980 RepID=A0ACB8BSB2_9AGAM|nr:hypothetical protein BV22DRAFT_1126199 [Leucogyrophana mollusca]
MAMSLSLTVHNFSHNLDASPSCSASKLEQGHALVNAASSSSGWVNRSPGFDSSTFKLNFGKLYMPAMGPPKLSVQAQQGRDRGLKEWGAPLDDEDDCFALADLEEFESADFSSILAVHRNKLQPHSVSPHPCVVPQHRSRPTSPVLLPEEPPRKRLRFDASSISSVIPQPHFLAAPSASFLPPDTRRITPYTKVKPHPIAPYTHSSLEQLISSPYSRGTWLIPIRGSLPWEGSTRASILEPISDGLGPAEDLRPSGPLNGQDNTSHITWTHESVKSFWQFLVSIQRAKTLGPISLSFHAAPSNTAFSVNATSKTSVSSVNQYNSLPGSKPSIEDDGFSAYVCSARMQMTDFIKVYHDAKYTMYIRNVLDAYQFVLGPKSATVDTSFGDPKKPEKIRILKGARLVFLDDCSKGAFLM